MKCQFSARSFGRYLASILTCIWISEALLVAQTLTGSILGSVRDPAGLAISGARIELTQITTGAIRATRTNELGDFAVASLQPSEYSLKVTMDGFRPMERTAIMLTASEVLSLGEVVLQVGSPAETVTVTSQPPPVQTASSERAGVITADQIEEIQTLGRNVMDLVGLLPGVVPQSGDVQSPQQSWNGYINGNRVNATGMAVDGMGLNQPGGNQNFLLAVSQDSIAEVKVLMTNYQAEYGRFSGANVQVVSKSGARDFHGMASYFKRNEEFNASNFFNNRLGISKAPCRYNTWTYNIGGPVYVPGKFNKDKEKLFFFWSQEFWPSKSATLKTVTVPTALERSGNFSQSVDVNNKLIAVKDPLSGLQFPGNIVPASRLDSSGQSLLKVFPLPNFTNRSVSLGNYNYIDDAENSNPTTMRTLRVDYNISSRHQLFGSYIAQHVVSSGYAGTTNTGNWDELNKTYQSTPKLLTVRYETVLSPTTVNELTLGANGRRETDYSSPAALALNQRNTTGFNVGQLYPADNPLNLLPDATFGGVTGAATLNYYTASPLNATRLAFVLTDTFSKTLGAHLLKAGGTAERSYCFGCLGGSTFNGSFSFATDANNPYNSGYAYANAILGVFDSYTESTGHFGVTTLDKATEWFVQDSWKVNRRLTLELGLRFYWIQPRVTRYGLLSGFVPGRYDPAQAVQLISPAMVGGKRVALDPITKTAYPVAAIGAISLNSGNPADGLVVPAQTKDYPASLMDSPGVQPAPRFGFAWDPFGNGKMAIRSGFGIFYNRMDNASGPWLQSPLINSPTIYYGSLSTFLSAAAFQFPQNVNGLDRTAKTPASYNMSFSIQRDIGFDTVVDAAYVGTLGRHLMWGQNINAIPMGTQFVQQNPQNADPTNPTVALPQQFLRPITGYGDINYYQWGASSNYHSLQVTANRRFRRGLQFGASWTWSKTMDFVDTDTANIPPFVSPRWNYGMASFDHTHILKGNWLWNVPKLPWNAGPAKWVINGWQLSGITTFMSGAPLGITYTLVTAANITGTPSLAARVVVTSNPILPKSERTFSHNFRTNVFLPPAVGTLGNAAKTEIRGPGLNNWNLTAIKGFPIRERVHGQFRGEFYNAFNHTQFTALNTAAQFNASGSQVNAALSQFTAAASARVIQFAVRLQF